MKLPYLKELPSTEVSIIDFKGLNRTITAQSNQLVDCQNISLKYYPKIVSRQPRYAYNYNITNPQAIFVGKKLYYIANGGFYADGVLKFSGLSAGSKSMVLFHGKLCIFPDKKYYDEQTEATGNIGNGTAYPASGSCPDIDYACVHDNRIFGVKGSTVYACALGNMQDWTTFVDIDGKPSEIGAYAVDVASPGDFTGIIEYQNHVVAFKSNYMHELYGQKPSNFSVIEVAKTGALSNSAITEINSILYFVGSQGVMRYGGGEIINISTDLNENFTSASLGSDGRFLYASTVNIDNVINLYVYDTLTGLWSREDDSFFLYSNLGNTLYGLLTLSDWGYYEVYKLNAGTETVNWSFTISDLSEIGSIKKKNTKIVLCLSGEANSTVRIKISEDRESFRQVLEYVFVGGDTVRNIPISINAVSEFKLKISGYGYIEIYSIEKTIIGGGTGKNFAPPIPIPN